MTNTTKAAALGRKIRAQRQKMDMTQEELAHKTRSDQALVSKWEHGKNVPGTVHGAALVKLGIITLEEWSAAAAEKAEEGSK